MDKEVQMKKFRIVYQDEQAISLATISHKLRVIKEKTKQDAIVKLIREQCVSEDDIVTIKEIEPVVVS